MSEQLVKFLTETGGEPFNPPMRYSLAQQRLDAINFWRDSSTSEVEVQNLRQVNLQMLQSSVNNTDSAQRSCGLNVAFVPLRWTEGYGFLDLRKDRYDQLLDMFGVRAIRDLAHVSGMTFNILPRKSNDRVIGVQYSMFISNYLGLYYSYDEQSRLGHAVVWCTHDTREFHKLRLEDFRQSLIKFKDQALDPYLLLWILTSCILSSMNRDLTCIRRDVSAMETFTRHQGWRTELPQRAPESAMHLRLGKYSAALSGATTILASERRFVELSFEMIAAIKNPVCPGVSDLSKSTKPLYERIPEDLNFLEAQLRNQLSQIGVLGERVKTQQAAVQNLMNRYEMNLSLRVANSMRILAVVTVLFLPATFVASLFSTSMFSWHVDDGGSVSGQFWVYWIIAIPLTAVTVVAYILYNRSWVRSRAMHDEENSVEMFEEIVINEEVEMNREMVTVEEVKTI